MENSPATVDISKAAFVHDSAALYGSIDMGEDSSVWLNVVMRSEAGHIHIGKGSNIQDFVMIHTDPRWPVEVGDYCSITHHVTLHACKIGNNSLVGIGAIIMDGCEIGDNCIIGGATFLPPKTVIPDNSIVMGSPGKVTKTQNNFIANRMNALAYIDNAKAYAKGEHRAWDGDIQARMMAHMPALQEEYQRLFG